jgi:starch phosphorylase
MRKSMAQLTPNFATNRVVREYTERHYLPAASAYLERRADNGALGERIAHWQLELRQKWAGLHFGDATVETEGGQHVFVVQVYLNGLDPEAVRVELYADGILHDAPVRQEMQRMHRLVAAATGYAYVARVAAERPASDYTARLIPRHDNAQVPLEASQILWQR